MRTDPMHAESGDGSRIPVDVHSVNTLIVGAGAAGLKCAVSLYEQGVRDVAVVVDRLGNGTSNNSGSDKQTYYKLGVFGDEPDSPMEFARSLFAGGMMHGDLAYIEGVGSAPAFFELCRLGVPFPFNRYGAYVGYKTDHDPRQRATSAGPKTSKFMFEALLRQLRRYDIPVLDRHEVVRLLTCVEDGVTRACGAVCVRLDETYRENLGLVAINARNVVLATGGPGEMYAISVWPHGQVGSHGLALEIGAAANNLTELQFGLASVGFRWNLSGTYQQVIPDYFSTAADGVSDRRSFLHDTFRDMAHLATSIFLKGYQWPFHAARLQAGGSSLVDLAVYREIEAGRRVFMDFLHNPTPGPGMRPFRIAELHPEARDYLERSGAVADTPYARLQHMNPASIDLYAENGIDLREPLEVAVCAQHCNGGIRGDLWWESSIPHLFTIGELNGTHGVRPGGSALNSGQVGAVRAATRIAQVYRESPPDPECFARDCLGSVAALHREYSGWLAAGADALDPAEVRRDIGRRMSRAAAFVRSLSVARVALAEARDLFRRIELSGFRCLRPRQLARATEDRLLALTSIAFLEALVAYIETGGGSRGGYMILDPEGDLTVACPGGESLRHRSENLDKRGEILEVSLKAGVSGEFAVVPVPVRPLPSDDSWYETTWAAWGTGAIFRE